MSCKDDNAVAKADVLEDKSRIREGTVAVGDAAAGRVRRAFEDAGNGRGAQRGGDENCGAREGELADVRRRCRKRQHASRRCIESQEAEAV